MNEAASAKYTNRLITETSPYLLQHAHNPVDWHPWSDEAFARAKAEDKPVLLSVGYSACHWCHVMEHESFENEAVAGLMNKHFVNVKVDREERPDVDAIYMNAVQMMTGRGGWPMTVFLTPEGLPFFGGTYFPPNDRYGMPGFPKVLLSVAEAYRSRREEILESAGEILKELQQADHVNPPSGTLDKDVLDRAFANLSKRFDWTHGGFGGAPKFPSSFSLAFMLRHFKRTGEKAALEMVELSLQKMARGGIYDHLGGGFHRYSTDAKWLVPHFEKMLYDNALLARLYVEAYQATGDEFHRFVVEDVLDYVLREMTSPEGGFYSTQDADSEGEEGKFFVWTRKEVLDLLGEEEGDPFCRFYGVTEEGNFEHGGATVLNVSMSLSTVAKLKDTTEEHLLDVLARGRARLLGERETRVKPMRDDKQLTAWNGLMLHALARAGAVLERPDYLQAAVANADFVLDKLSRNGRLLRTHKDGESKLNAYLEDYAFFADGLLALYEATFDLRHLKRCVELADLMIDLFGDEETGGFYFTSKDHERLISRSRDLFDNATPSGNSVAVDVLSRLAAITGNQAYRNRAEKILASMRDMMVRMPSGFGYLLCALDFHLSAPTEIALVGGLKAEDTQDLLRTIRKIFLPNTVVVHKSPEDADAEALIPLLVGRTAVEGKATAYVCENMTCRLPASDAETLGKMLNDE